MLKYALISNGKVENIIVLESTDLIEIIKHQYQHIEFVGDENNSKDIHIGYLYENGKFFEDPVIIEQRQKELDNLKKQEEILTNAEKGS